MSFDQYWNKSVPWSYKSENLSYEQRRKMRYELHDYMPISIPFVQWKGRRVLEIGCGAGIDAAEFVRNGCTVTALDFAEESVKRTSETFKEAGVSGTVLHRPANKTGLPDAYYDAVYSFGVLHHIPEVDEVLEEITRVLKTEGEAVFMVYNKNSLLNAYSILFLHRGEGTDDDLATKYSERMSGNPYTKLYSANEAQDLFQRYFYDVRIETEFCVIDTPAQRKVKFQGPKDLGWHLLAFCKNPIQKSRSR